MWFINFMASQLGRVARFVLGAILIVAALAAWHGLVEVLVIALGLVLIAVAIFDVCLFAPLFGKSFSGKKLRSANDTK